jgi:hypothetical protein
MRYGIFSVVGDFVTVQSTKQSLTNVWDGVFVPADQHRPISQGLYKNPASSAFVEQILLVVVQPHLIDSPPLTATFGLFHPLLKLVFRHAVLLCFNL